MAEDALAFDAIDVSYLIRGTPRTVLRGLSFRIRRGEAYGLVGESGCGKSTAAFAAVRYLPRNGAVTAGRTEVNGPDPAGLAAPGHGGNGLSGTRPRVQSVDADRPANPRDLRARRTGAGSGGDAQRRDAR